MIFRSTQLGRFSIDSIDSIDQLRGLAAACSEHVKMCHAAEGSIQSLPGRGWWECTMHFFSMVTSNLSEQGTKTCLPVNLAQICSAGPVDLDSQTKMWANAQRDGHPAEYRWHPLFNAAKFGWRPLLVCRSVTLPRCKTRWNLQGCPKLTDRQNWHHTTNI